jgi:hypothetical protein
MNITGIREGDLVLCDVRGARFHAYVQARDERGLAVRPIERGISYRHVTARQVIAYWRRSEQSRGGGEPA